MLGAVLCDIAVLDGESHRAGLTTPRRLCASPLFTGQPICRPDSQNIERRMFHSTRIASGALG
jgi:hypothetical protein